MKELPKEIHLDCSHTYEQYVADGTTPYLFCPKCKSTFFNGIFYPLKSKENKQSEKH